MIKVTLELMANLRSLVGQKEVSEEIPENTTLLQFLRSLGQKYGDKFNELVLDKEGNVWEFIVVMVNDRQFDRGTGYDAPLKEGDRVAILLPMAGGALC